MRIGSAFPSDYLKASDLGGRMATVTMDRVEMRELGSDVKPVLFFVGKQRGLVLNKTNASTISDSYGDETETWAGKPLILFEAVAEFQGRRMPAIRVRVPAPSKEAAPVEMPAPPPAEPRDYGNGLDDEIPF